MRILTVCLGNICRSPAAEAAIRSSAQDAGVEIEVDSAGTGRYHIGDGPNPRSAEAGAEVGLEVVGRARQITMDDFNDFDLIVAMDHSNYEDLQRMAPTDLDRKKVRLFRDFDPDSTGEAVPDPYYGDYEDYREMIQIILPAAKGLVRELQESSA